LEDGTITVHEPKAKNAGFLQGIIVQRQRCPKPSTNDEFFDLEDLRLGNELLIYGKLLHLCRADIDTERALIRIGFTDIGVPQDIPNDSYATMRTTQEARIVRPGKTEPDPFRQFLENDGHVLRLFATLEGENADNELRKFEINYYLADDTVQVTEKFSNMNSGRAHSRSTVIVKRFKVSREIISQIRIGNHFEVLGRKYSVYDYDEFTRKYMKDNHGVTDYSPIQLVEPQPFKGIPLSETTEDYGEQQRSLIPKAPKKDFKKILETDRTNLRFSGSLMSNREEDQNRNFVITFFTSDNTITIYENPQKNSGFAGGKFLDRRRVEKSGGAGFYAATDFFVGAVVEVYRHKFILADADDYALKFMEATPEVFPNSDLVLITKKLKDFVLGTSSSRPNSGNRPNSRPGSSGVSKPTTPVDLKAKFRAFDKDNSGYISMAEFRELLLNLGVQLTEQEIYTLMIRYDLDDDGQISYEEFVVALK